MFDLHTHLLPGIDDGAKTLADSLAMARIAVDDGIRVMACTPHIYPGMYMNNGPDIARRVKALQESLNQAGIPLRLVVGADVHLVPGLLAGLRNGSVPTLHGSRYFLLEPSHTTPPPRFEDSVFDLIVAGYTPIITHPERLTWVENHYPVFLRLIEQGAWMQVTASALTGLFGPRAKYWGERFLGEGHTHVLASDAHSPGRRVPRMREAVAIAENLLGREEARKLVVERPQAVLENRNPDAYPLPAGKRATVSRLGQWFSGFGAGRREKRSKIPQT